MRLIRAARTGHFSDASEFARGEQATAAAAASNVLPTAWWDESGFGECKCDIARRYRRCRLRMQYRCSLRQALKRTKPLSPRRTSGWSPTRSHASSPSRANRRWHPSRTRKVVLKRRQTTRYQLLHQNVEQETIRSDSRTLGLV